MKKVIFKAKGFFLSPGFSACLTQLIASYDMKTKMKIKGRKYQIAKYCKRKIIVGREENQVIKRKDSKSTQSPIDNVTKVCNSSLLGAKRQCTYQNCNYRDEETRMGKSKIKKTQEKRGKYIFKIISSGRK